MTTDTTTKDETYLGDGLYGSCDGAQIILRAPRANGDHWVGLEPEIFQALLNFAESLNKKYNVEYFNLGKKRENGT